MYADEGFRSRSRCFWLDPDLYLETDRIRVFVNEKGRIWSENLDLKSLKNIYFLLRICIDQNYTKASIISTGTGTCIAFVIKRQKRQ